MSVLFVLIAVSLVFASGFLLAFIWAMNDRQFEDDHTPAVRMLFENSVSGGQQVSKSADRVFSKSGGKVLSDSPKLFCEDVKKTSPDPNVADCKSSIANRYSAINKTSPDPSLPGEEIRGAASSEKRKAKSERLCYPSSLAPRPSSL